MIINYKLTQNYEKLYIAKKSTTQLFLYGFSISFIYI